MKLAFLLYNQTCLVYNQTHFLLAYLPLFFLFFLYLLLSVDSGLVGVFRASLAILSLLEPRLMALTDPATMQTLLLRVPVEL